MLGRWTLTTGEASPTLLGCGASVRVGSGGGGWGQERTAQVVDHALEPRVRLRHAHRSVDVAGDGVEDRGVVEHLPTGDGGGGGGDGGGGGGGRVATCRSLAEIEVDVGVAAVTKKEAVGGADIQEPT